MLCRAACIFASFCRLRPRSLSPCVMEDSTPATDRRSKSTASLERADLEAFIGEVVHREMSGQQAGPSENPLVGGAEADPAIKEGGLV